MEDAAFDAEILFALSLSLCYNRAIMLTRRNFLKLAAASLGSAVATACGRAISTPTPTPDATPTRLPPTAAPSITATPGALELVTIRGDQFFLHGARFPIKGLNYYPMRHPWRMFNVGEWDAQETERELQLATGLGANVVRVFIDYQASLGNPAVSFQFYYSPSPQYIANVREFLGIAARLNLKVIVTLFDGMDWGIYQPTNQWIAEEYLKEFLPAFVGDPRILSWDLQNEPDRAISIVGAESVIPFFRRVSAQIRALDPQHLQTIGWIDRARCKYFAALDNDLDFWCFHFYDKIENLGGLFQFYKSTTTKPVLLEEFGLATGGPGFDGAHTELDQMLHYSSVFALLDGYQMCGSVFWILTDFPKGLAGNPPIPGDSPENHYGVFRLDYSEKLVASEIRYSWKPG